MGNCNNICNACGDESTQIKTLDQSQLKHGIKDKDYAHNSEDYQ